MRACTLCRGKQRRDRHVTATWVTPQQPKMQLCAGELVECTEVVPDAAGQQALSHPDAGAGSRAGACSH